MRPFLAGVLTGTLVLLLSVFLFLHLGLAVVHADDTSPSWVADFLDASIHASVRRQASRQTTVVPIMENGIIAGGELYLNDCVGCHGAPGKPASNFGASFYPPAPQLALKDTTYTEAEAFWIAKHGIRRSGMSAQSGPYSDDQLHQLSAFICSMRRLPPGVMTALEQKTPTAAPPSESGK